MKPSEEVSSPFDEVADASAEETTRERWAHTADAWILAPGRVLVSDYRALIGSAILLGYILVGTVGVLLLQPPEMFEAPKYLQPFQDWTYPLGADHQGRGLLRQTVHATPPMLKMMASGAVFTTAMATVIGTFSGYKGGVADRALMFLTDIAITLPTLPLIILIAASVAPRNPFLVGLMLSINAWGGLARTVRSQVLSLREQSYVEASRAMGVSTKNILFNDVLPNLMPYIVVNFVQAARRVIFASVGLYFLGFLPFNVTNWGVQLQLAFGNGAMISPSTWYWIAIPMMAVTFVSYGLILFGQGTDRLFNPRIRARHEKSSADVDEYSAE